MPFLAAIPAIIAGAAEAAVGVAGAVADVAATAASAAATAASSVAEVAGSVATTVAEGVGDAVGSIGEGIAGESSMSDALSGAGQALRQTATQVGKSAKDLKSTLDDLGKVGKDDKLGQVKDATKATDQLHSILNDDKKIKQEMTTEKGTLSDTLASTKSQEAQLKVTDDQLNEELKKMHLSSDQESGIKAQLKDDATKETADDASIKKINTNITNIGSQTTKIDKADVDLNKQDDDLTKKYNLEKPPEATQLTQPNQRKVAQYGQYTSSLNNTLNTPEQGEKNLNSFVRDSSLSLPTFSPSQKQAEVATPTELTDIPKSHLMSIASPFLQPTPFDHY